MAGLLWFAEWKSVLNDISTHSIETGKIIIHQNVNTGFNFVKKFNASQTHVIFLRSDSHRLVNELNKLFSKEKHRCRRAESRYQRAAIFLSPLRDQCRFAVCTNNVKFNSSLTKSKAKPTEGCVNTNHRANWTSCRGTYQTCMPERDLVL